MNSRYVHHESSSPHWLMHSAPEIILTLYYCSYPDSKVLGANMGPTWVLSAPDGPRVGPMNLAIRVTKGSLDINVWCLNHLCTCSCWWPANFRYDDIWGRVMCDKQVCRKGHCPESLTVRIHWCRNKMVEILRATFSWVRLIAFWFNFHIFLLLLFPVPT